MHIVINKYDVRFFSVSIHTLYYCLAMKCLFKVISKIYP